MNILVTGGSGFIGRNIVKMLKEQGNTVTTLDTAEKNSISDYHIRADVREMEKVREACRKKEYVFHLAAVTAPPEFENLMGEGFETNVVGTYNVLASSAVEGVRRVIIASSSSVYGQSSRPTSESDIPDSYSNFYPLSKRVNEMTGKSFRRYGLETVSLRYFNTYGTGENSKGNYSSVIWKFIDDIRGGRKPVIYGDGKQRRDFIYVRDTARASVLAMENGRDGEEYNVGTGRSVDFNTIFKIVKEETGYEGDAVHIPNPLKSYQLFTQAVMKKSNDELKFFPEYDVRKGVREMIESVG